MIRKKGGYISLEEFKEICANSSSYRDVVAALGYSHGGRANSQVKNEVEEHGIDISHFLGQAHSKGLGKRVRPIEDYLENRVGIKSYALKERLFEENFFEKKCYSCGGSEWLGHQIPLELHHIDGDPKNNSLNNLVVLCPNCHAQTSNYRGKNKT